MSPRSIFKLGAMAAALVTCMQAQAIAPQPAPGLLPTAVARPLMEQDPAVLAARAELAAGQAESRALHDSPHDFTLKTTGQQRRIDGSGNYREWNVGIERGIRLPGKASADHQLADATNDRAEAGVGEALHESARTLISLWVDWLAAERALDIAFDSQKSFNKSVSVVEKRVRAGDAANLELNLAKAELMEQSRLGRQAETATETAWTRLSIRFPGIARDRQPLPPAMPINGDVPEWTARIMEQSDELKLAVFGAEQAQALAKRAKADRIPDPSIGMFTASEVGGRERFTGVTLTVPFGMPGGYRSEIAAQASANAEASKQASSLKRREFESEIASAFVEARGAYDSWRMASDSARAMEDNAGFVERAYALGEADLPQLLLARRQAYAAANSALEQQAMALKKYYTLVVDAHWVWDLEHDE